MRVHDSNLNAVTIGTRHTKRADTVETGGGKSREPLGSAGDDDRVSLSDLSRAVHEAAEDSARTERITRLAAAHRGGSLRVHAADVAKGIIDDAMTVR